MQIPSDDVFLLPERRAILVRLRGFEWNFSLGAVVYLRSRAESLEMRQIGTGNHEGRPALLLTPTHPWESVESQLQAMVTHGPLTLEAEATS